MKRQQCFAYILATGFITHPAIADVTNPTYLAAKTAMNNGDCRNAAPTFEKYLLEDVNFLKKNTDFRSSIEALIKYCKAMANSPRGEYYGNTQPGTLGSDIGLSSPTAAAAEAAQRAKVAAKAAKTAAETAKMEALRAKAERSFEETRSKTDATRPAPKQVSPGLGK